MPSDVIDNMLHLTAEIAEDLLSAKDEGIDLPSDQLKEKIAQLAELASSSIIDENKVCEEFDGPTNNSPMPHTSQHSLSEEPSLHDIIEEDSYIESEAEQLPDNSDPYTEPSRTSDDDDTIGNQVVKADDCIPQPDASASPLVTYEEIMQSFSLNDMYLFRRSLFGGDAGAMRSALTKVASCNSLDDVRTLLRNDLGINPRSSDAKAFLAALAPFFD